MFGYVQYDKPNLYIKDFELYRAVYCGTCKAIGKACGQIARFGLSYDIAFFNVLLHNIRKTDVEVKKQSCFTKCFQKRPMSLVDELSLQVGAFNTLLLYYKLSDDVADEKHGRWKRACFRSSFRRAVKKYPDLAEIVGRCMREQNEIEKTGTDSIDLAAEQTARMMQEVSRLLLGEYATEDTDGLFYDIGKWIYLIDAADDYDKDVKRKNFNVFYNAYGAKNKETLLKEREGDLRFVFHTVLYDLRERMGRIAFGFNRDLTDNVLLRGLPMQTERVVFCAHGKECANRKEKKGER